MSFDEKFADRNDWRYISEYRKLPEAMIEKFANPLHWDCISGYQNLSDSFIEEDGSMIIKKYIAQAT